MGLQIAVLTLPHPIAYPALIATAERLGGLPLQYDIAASGIAQVAFRAFPRDKVNVRREDNAVVITDHSQWSWMLVDVLRAAAIAHGGVARHSREPSSRLPVSEADVRRSIRQAKCTATAVLGIFAGALLAVVAGFAVIGWLCWHALS